MLFLKENSYNELLIKMHCKMSLLIPLKSRQTLNVLFHSWYQFGYCLSALVEVQSCKKLCLFPKCLKSQSSTKRGLGLHVTLIEESFSTYGCEVFEAQAEICFLPLHLCCGLGYSGFMGVGWDAEPMYILIFIVEINRILLGEG